MSWIDDARAERARFYIAFRGSAGAREVAWGTDTIHRVGHGNDSLLEARMRMPQSIVRGMPETYSGAIERVSVRLELANADGELDWLLHGGEAPAGAFLKDSALTVTGKLYAGLVDSGEEIPITPTLALAAQASQEGRWISLPLASRDDLILGRPRRLVSLGDLRHRSYALASGIIASRSQYRGARPAADWDEIRGQLDGDEAAIIPWAYGRTAIRLTPGTGDATRTKSHYIAWIQFEEPPLLVDDWIFTGPTYHEPPGDRLSLYTRPRVDDKGIVREHLSWVFAFPIRITLKEEDLDVWVIGLELKGDRVDQGDQYVIPSQLDRVGMGPGEEGGLHDLVRAMVRDHSELGEAAVHAPSYWRARRASTIHGVAGGVVASEAPLWERLQHLGALGLAMWIDTDDRLRMLPIGAWSEDEITLAEAGVPKIGIQDIAAGTWREWIPAGEERGAPARRLTIEWSPEQARYWPGDLLMRRPAIMRRAKVLEETEARVSGAWVFPPLAEDALAMIGTLRVWPTRRMECVVSGLWAAALELGDLVRVSHPDGAAPGGYQGRLARVERIEILADELGVRLQLEDLGWLDGVRPGRLDSITHWMIYDPRGTSQNIQLQNGRVEVRANAPIFSQAMVGAHLRVWGASRDALRREYRIMSVISDTRIEVYPTPTANETVWASPLGTPLGRSAWFICHSRASLGPNYRPWAITLAGEESGVHSNGTPAYRLLGG